MAGGADHCEVCFLAEEKVVACDLIVFPVLLVVLPGKSGVFELRIVVVEVFDVFDDGSRLCGSLVSHTHVVLLAGLYLPPTT